MGNFGADMTKRIILSLMYKSNYASVFTFAGSPIGEFPFAMVVFECMFRYA
jgi:hypothetical protein